MSADPAMTRKTDAPAAVVFDFPDTTERRLRLALRKLDAALAEQRVAVAAFRAQLGELNGAVVRLGDRATALRGALAETAADTARAQAASRELMATAETLEGLTRR